MHDQQGSSLITFDTINFRGLCDKLASKEKIFSSILKAYGYPPCWQRQPGFETLIHIILEQQVSLASALAAFNKLKAKLTTITPAALLRLDDDDLKACYFSRQKIIYARQLAEAVMEGRLAINKLDALNNETVEQQLLQVKGIGKWTTDVYLMMALHRADCFPIGDIALVKSMKQEFQLTAATSRDDLLSMADHWRPFRTIAAYFLWHAYLTRRKGEL